MINRYTNKKIQEIWSDEHKYNIWLKIEQLICESWVRLNIMDKSNMKTINNLKVDLKRMLEIEQETKHDVVAFTRMLSEQIGTESRWIHLGITSTDVVDTAQNYLINLSNKIVNNEILKMMEVLQTKAFKHKDTLIMGRTHGMYGEPTSLGLKFALWFEEFKRHLVRLQLANEQISVAKISGSMGNYANLELEIEQYVAEQMNLNIDNISTQITQRDRHLFLFEVLAGIATTLEKIATEIRLFQRSDVNEWAEGFEIGQKGSSSMPHKKNPISSENISGLSRMIKSYVFVALENNNLWHERDISHSSNERVMFPDAFNLIVYTLQRMIGVIENLIINQDNINKHIEESKNIFFSQRIMTYLIMNNNNLTRELIYDEIQAITLTCLANKTDFKEAILESSLTTYVNKQELESLFDIKFFNRQTKKIFDRIFENNQ